MKFRLKKLVLGAAHSDNFVTVACTTLIQYSSVTDRWTPKLWLRDARSSLLLRVKI